MRYLKSITDQGTLPHSCLLLTMEAFDEVELLNKVLCQEIFWLEIWLCG